MRKILLIGGAGYVGTIITSHFLKKGHKVSVLDNFVYDNHSSVQSFIGDPDYTLIKGDLGNKSDLELASLGVTDVVILGGLH